ncbi:MAG: hypothetical protein ACSLE5_08355 [Porticoccaceae bacterium]
MAMAAEVLHPSPADQEDWNRTVRWNYIKALVTKLPLAFYNWFVHSRIDHLPDAEFAAILATTNYSKFLRRRSADELAATEFGRRLGPLDPARQYLTADFTPIQDVQPYPGMYVAPTIVLLARDGERGSAGVLAISIGHLEGDGWQHVVLTPADVKAWVLAKYFAIQGGAHMVTLCGHPATHFPYDTVNAITQSSVPMKHTLFKLLKPHLRLQLPVDNAVLEGGNSVVSETRGEFYAPFVGTSTEVRQMVAAGYLGYPNPLSKYAPADAPGPAHPRWSYATAVRDIPSDYGLYLTAYHDTVKRFVRKVVAHILAMQDSDRGREEIYYIRRWAHYIAGWLPGFPDDDEILAMDESGDPRLVTAVTTFIWDVAIAHGAEHCTFGKLGPHRTGFRVRVPPPDSRQAPAYSRRQILSGWDMFKSTLAFEMFFKPHNVALLKDVTYDFDSETLRAAAGQFIADLAATEQRLIKDGVDIRRYARVDELASSIQY